MTFHLQGEIEADYINVLNQLEEMQRDYFSQESGHLAGDSFQNLSKSDYAKVIFCDLYYNSDGTVGCKFQITDNVHEDPCDYIGLFRVGYDNLTQCLASKMLSQTECEDDGKLLRCTFKSSELPELENGFYQFLYVTRDNEVCGASMPFHVKNSTLKDLSSDEDIVAENSEDDFLVVRSNMAEKNRRLQELVDEMNEKLLVTENEMRQIQEKLKLVIEEKCKTENMLRQTVAENVSLMSEAHAVKEEKKKICKEKEEAVRILQEKNSVFSTMFDDYSDKLKEFAEFKNTLLSEKKRILAFNSKLQEQIKKLSEELENRESLLKLEKEKKQEVAISWRNESSILASKLDDARLMIEALEKNKQLSLDELTSLNEEIKKLQEQLKLVKCENLTLKTQLIDSVLKHEKHKDQMDNMSSEITSLKLHIIEMHEASALSGVHVDPRPPLTPYPRASEDNPNGPFPKEVMKMFEDLPKTVSAVTMELQKAGSSSEVIKEQLSNLKMQQTNEVLKGLKLQEETEACVKPVQETEDLAALKLQQKNEILKDLKFQKLLKESLQAVPMPNGWKVHELRQKNEVLHSLIDQACENFDSSKKQEEIDSLSVQELKEQNELLIESVQLLKNKLQDSSMNKEIDRLNKRCTDYMIELREKELIIFKLNQELIKSHGVIEYLTKEKESVQKNGSLLQDALNESILRLSEGSELYKKQFRKIEKLKKKLKKSKTDFEESQLSESVAELSDEAASTSTMKLPQVQNSDSDTGEHVIRHPANTLAEASSSALSNAMRNFVAKHTPVAVAAPMNEPPSSTVREVPGLQTLIEMNLEKFKNSQSKEDDVMFAIPCPVCDQDIGVNMTSTEELIKHLEVQHKQQVCPVCGRLFDMTLPPKYFVFHVEDHFVKENKN